MTAAPKWQPLKINGVKLRFSPHILLDRTDKKNQKQRGALMFRYAKGAPLKPEVASYQSAAIFGILREISDKEAEEVDKPLCVTVDGITGAVYAADGKAASSYLLPQYEGGAGLHRGTMARNKASAECDPLVGNPPASGCLNQTGPLPNGR